MNDFIIDTAPNMKVAITLLKQDNQSFEDATLEVFHHMMARVKQANLAYNSYHGNDENTIFYNRELLKRNINRLLQTYYLYFEECLKNIKAICDKEEIKESDIDYLYDKYLMASKYIGIKSKLVSSRKYGYYLENGNAIAPTEEEIANFKESVSQIPFSSLKNAKTVLEECKNCINLAKSKSSNLFKKEKYQKLDESLLENI